MKSYNIFDVVSGMQSLEFPKQRGDPGFGNSEDGIPETTHFEGIFKKLSEVLINNTWFIKIN